MQLRNQLLALSLVTLLLPYSGWRLVQELENFLREGEEDALLVSAKTLALALPQVYQLELEQARGQVLPLRQLITEPILDGYLTDWPEPGQSLVFETGEVNTAGAGLKLNVLAGRHGSHFYLALKVTNPGAVRATTFNTGMAQVEQRAGVMLYLQTRRAQRGFMISTEAPGPLTISSLAATGNRLQAAWMDTADGYQLELVLPEGVERLSVGAVAPAVGVQGGSGEHFAGTLQGRAPGQWLELLSRDAGVAQWLARVVPDKSRAWLVQSAGWVMADSGPNQTADESDLTWVQRIIYQAVADSRMQPRDNQPDWPVRLQSIAVQTALAGADGKFWSRDADSAAVFNRVAVPVVLKGELLGAMVLETRSEGLLLLTNRALGRLSFIALLLVVVLGAGLWLFATRLSRRVQKLSAAVSHAMDDTGRAPKLPVTGARDELGELARNTEKLLRAVAEYTRYLQKLAGRLSHELKTPLAITRSSLDNLASQDLDSQAQQYLLRAREGVDRQAAIVAAMSEAQRLEGAIRSQEWECIDLGAMLGHCVAAYRSVHPERKINLSLPAAECKLRCAPELLAQALDKLVDNAVTLSTPDCPIDIALQTEAGASLISVTNSGTRLPDVLPEQLFDSLVSMREKQGRGRHLGLGLYIVRLVAEAHGGTVNARNLADGDGVVFTIRLPAS